MQLGDRKIKGQGHVCPDCKAFLRRRTSEMRHLLLQHVYFACANIDCGATFAGRTEIVCRLSPPRLENPEINLPYSSHSEFHKGMAARAAKKRDQHKAEINARTPAQLDQLRRERIARMLARGDSFAAIQEKLVCGADMVLSVKTDLEKNTGVKSE